MNGQAWASWFESLQTAVLVRRGVFELDTLARLERARALIDRAYAEPLDLDALAAAAAFSRYHFLRSFRAAYGETPHRYLTERRIVAARRLLEETALPVTEVCARVGFESLGSFSTLFQKKVGRAPSHYRRRSVVVPPPTLGPIDRIPACFLTMYRAA